MGNILHTKIPKEFLDPSTEFQHAMDNMEIYWWYWDVQRLKLILNPELINILGYTNEDSDTLVPFFSKNIHPDDIELNRRNFENLLEEKKSVYESEYRLKIKGKWLWYYNRGTVISRDANGRPLMVGGITMNISDRYNRMIHKVEEGRKFEFIFKNTSEPVLIVKMAEENKAGKIVEVNDAAAKLFDCKPGDLIGLDPYELIDEGYASRREELRRRIFQKGSITMDFVSKDFKGRTKYVEVNSHIFSHTGEDLYIAVVKDKTESQNFLNELKASELALKQSDEVLQSLIKAADDRIGLFDSEGNIIIINDAFANTLGFSREEFLKLDDKERIHPDDLERLKIHHFNLLKSGHLATEYRVQHKDGHYLYMFSKSVLLKNPSHKKDYILVIIRDITDRAKFQKELINAKEKAEESAKLKSAFLANMSHEIRTPMNSIVGFANLLSEENVDDKSRKEYVRRINRNSEHLLTLISDIIDLAKIESNQMSVSYTSVIVDNLFSDLSNFGKRLLKERDKKSVNLTYDPDPKYPKLKIESDLVRLTQILQNLLNNAVKFTIEGEICIGFRVQKKNKVLFYVKDTGPGIESKYFDVIFDQFRQIDGSDIRKFGGTGLGLAICKNLAILLSGKIWLESVKGEGSTFYLELPVKSGMNINQSKNSGTDNYVNNSNISVLMVDDDQDSLLLLSTLLRSEGLHVKTVDSGYKALEILENEGLPDLVLLDLEMPVLNGIQTLKIIRDLYPDLKIVAQSAHALEGDKEKMLASGFDNYISKPYNKKDLMKVIASSRK